VGPGQPRTTGTVATPPTWTVPTVAPFAVVGVTVAWMVPGTFMPRHPMAVTVLVATTGVWVGPTYPTTCPALTTVYGPSTPSTAGSSVRLEANAAGRMPMLPPRWPRPVPTTVTALPEPLTRAANIRHPPEALIEPVLMPTTPSEPSSRLVLRTQPASGTTAL